MCPCAACWEELCHCQGCCGPWPLMDCSSNHFQKFTQNTKLQWWQHSSPDFYSVKFILMFNPSVQIMFEYLHSTDIHRLDIIYNANLLVLTTAVCSPDRCHLRPGRAGGLHVHWNPAGLYHGVRLRHHSQIQTSISNFIYPSTSHCQDHYC